MTHVLLIAAGCFAPAGIAWLLSKLQHPRRDGIGWGGPGW